jgi:streptogramin lyase
VLAGAARHPRAIALAGVLMLASTATIFVAARPHDGRGRLAAASGSALAEIDPASNRVVAAFPVGGTPTGVAVSGTAIWALNGDEQTVSRIDRSTHATTTFSTGAVPVDIAVDANGLWLLRADAPRAFGRPSGVPATLARLDPASLLQRSSTTLGQLPGPECCPTPPA